MAAEQTLHNASKTLGEWSLPPEQAIPKPTYAPAMLAMGVTLLMWGVVASWVFSAAGFVISVVALKNWIGEMVHDR